MVVDIYGSFLDRTAYNPPFDIVKLVFTTLFAPSLITLMTVSAPAIVTGVRPLHPDRNYYRTPYNGGRARFPPFDIHLKSET